MKTLGYFLTLLLFAWGSGQDLFGQKRLDSIVKYAHTDVGNDSIAIAKSMLDYNGEGQLIAKRKLYTSDYVHWENELRTTYGYDTKGRLERTGKDSFLKTTNSWKDYFYSNREYSSDSDYVIRFYERNGKQFDTIKKYIRKSFFSDGERKAIAKFIFKSRSWTLHTYDSVVMNHHQNAVSKRFSLKGTEDYYWSGPKTRFFRLDSSVYKNVNGLVAKMYKITTVPNRVIYVTKSEKGEGFKGTYTSDSSVYFINSQGLRDSMHRYEFNWQSSTRNGISQKVFYLWTGSQLTGIREYSWYNGKIEEFDETMDFSAGSGALGKDTVFYKLNSGRNGMEIDFKKSTNIGINGYLRSTSYYKMSPTVDSFQLHEREIRYYSDPLISTASYQNISFSVFPNPSKGQIHIIGNSDMELALYDIRGRLLCMLKPSENGDIIEEKGLFLLKNMDSGNVTKILIQ